MRLSERRDHLNFCKVKNLKITEDNLNILKAMDWLNKANATNIPPQMNEKMELIQIVKDSPERNAQFLYLFMNLTCD